MTQTYRKDVCINVIEKTRVKRIAQVVRAAAYSAEKAGFIPASAKIFILSLIRVGHSYYNSFFNFYKFLWPSLKVSL